MLVCSRSRGGGTSRTLQSWPMAMPILRSGMPWGQLKLTSKASTPTSSHFPISSSHGPFSYSSMMEAISILQTTQMHQLPGQLAWPQLQ